VEHDGFREDWIEVVLYTDMSTKTTATDGDNALVTDCKPVEDLQNLVESLPSGGD
jgi:hypothetical protein